MKYVERSRNFNLVSNYGTVATLEITLRGFFKYHSNRQLRNDNAKFGQLGAEVCKNGLLLRR